MATALLTIRCHVCGREENIIEFVKDDTVDFNLDKMCAACSTWMSKRELILIGTIWATRPASPPVYAARPAATTAEG